MLYNVIIWEEKSLQIICTNLYLIDFDATLSMFTMIEFINLDGKLLLVSGSHLWALFFIIITTNGCSSTKEGYVSSQIEELRREEGQAD